MKAANKLLEKYLLNYNEKFDSYEFDLKFRQKGENTIATYNVAFKDIDGCCFCEVFSFVL